MLLSRSAERLSKARGRILQASELAVGFGHGAFSMASFTVTAVIQPGPLTTYFLIVGTAQDPCSIVRKSSEGVNSMAVTVKIDVDGTMKPGETKKAYQSAVLTAIREEVEAGLNKIKPDEQANYGKCTYTKQVAAM